VPANVRCIGQRPALQPVDGPCGWEGHLAGGVVDFFDCPNCGGWVELFHGESVPEMRGEWPGGITTDPETGHLKFEVNLGERDEDAHPVWACKLCAGKRKHTRAEHEALIAKVAR
jgi:hypothetical protein